MGPLPSATNPLGHGVLNPLGQARSFRAHTGQPEKAFLNPLGQPAFQPPGTTKEHFLPPWPWHKRHP